MFGVCFTGSRTWLAKPNNRHRQVGIGEAQKMNESDAINLATAQGTYFGNRPIATACEIHRANDGTFYVRVVGTSDWGHWIGY